MNIYCWLVADPTRPGCFQLGGLTQLDHLKDCLVWVGLTVRLGGCSLSVCWREQVRPDHISLNDQLGLPGTAAQAAMTKCHEFGDPGNRTLSPQGSGGRNCEVKYDWGGFFLWQ
jgi:hypothetical protein